MTDRSFRLVAATCTFVAVAIACTSDVPTGGGGGGPISPTTELPAGLRQFVTVSNDAPAGGEDIQVRSVLRNDTTVAITVETRICGLSWGGNLRVGVTPGLPPCSGWSDTTLLAPGDSVVGSASWRVLATPGSYVVYVGQIVVPAYGHPVPIVVH